MMMLCISFVASTLMVGWQEGQPVRKKPVPLVRRGTVLKRVEEEDPSEGTWLTQIHLERVVIKWK